MNIRRYLLLFGCLVSLEAIAQNTRGGVHSSLTVASDYKMHGLSQTQSRPVSRFAIDYEHDSGFFAGGFVANVDYVVDSRRPRQRETQVDYYAGYVWRGRNWSTSAAINRYVYPDAWIRYDYSEVVVGFSFRQRFFFNAGYSDKFLSFNRSAYHYDAGIALPWIWDLEFGANLGRLRASEFRGTDFSYWDLGLSRVIGRFGLDLRYYDNHQTEVNLMGEPGGDNWVFSISYAITPRAP